MKEDERCGALSFCLWLDGIGELPGKLQEVNRQTILRTVCSTGKALKTAIRSWPIKEVIANTPLRFERKKRKLTLEAITMMLLGPGAMLAAAAKIDSTGKRYPPSVSV
ncbi:hypothetical protein [Pseudomonas sp. GL-B-16]|uniref:hypothetical protein n=1 Tax=Pseudomonas sp. GL-B-16 TaxID=2832373 RepID=UPI001CBABF22|nr:hypothetical protein [Pseudomonas sp. GL-B-16]